MSTTLTISVMLISQRLSTGPPKKPFHNQYNMLHLDEEGDKFTWMILIAR
jgi:hypothetical protein